MWRIAQQHRGLVRSWYNCNRKLFFSDWGGARGYDLTQDLLSGTRPKVVLHGYGPTGFDVTNVVKKVAPDEVAESGSIHMNGSIMVFPFGCFLWNVKSAEQVTMESLAPVLLHRPRMEYLFIGSETAIPRQEMDRIKLEMSKQNIVVEKLNLANAMGTFNILNAEGRQVVVALVQDPMGDGL